MKVTIKNIAKDLNLSKTTVSFVLSGIGPSKGVSVKTQEKIIQYAKEKGYQPNLLAKSLYSGKTNTIGVIIPSIGDMFYAELVKELEIEAKKSGYMLMICSSERDVEQEVKMIRMLKTKQVDGLIMAPTEYCRDEISNLLEEGFPFVLVDRYYPGLKTNYVVINDFGSSYMLVNRLIEKRHKKIALFTPNTHMTTVSMRKEGYLKALEDAGMLYDENLYCEVDRNNYCSDIIDVLDKLFSKVPDVDAFYFTTHYLALETILYCFRKGIDINRFGLACIHRNPMFATLAPNMDVAAIPMDEMGHNAIKILLDDMNNGQGKNNKISFELRLSI